MAGVASATPERRSDSSGVADALRTQRGEWRLRSGIPRGTCRYSGASESEFRGAAADRGICPT
jgi:hypothetical protein